MKEWVTLENLRPGEIGTSYGRELRANGPALPQRRLVEFLPRVVQSIPIVVRGVVIGLALFCGLLAVAAREGVLLGSGVASPIGLLLGTDTLTTAIELPLLKDPAGLFLAFACAATMMFTSQQVLCIGDAVQRAEANSRWREKRFDAAEISAEIAKANNRFAVVGERRTSWGVLYVAVLLTAAIMSLASDGLMENWRPDAVEIAEHNITRQDWGDLVYAGWWANYHEHPWSALALSLLGVYFFYHLLKQLLMGAVVAVFMTKMLRYEFGAVPNLVYNNDGYWGLRSIRRLLQWTYFSTLTHQVAALCLLVMWLPLGDWTPVAGLLVVLTGAAVVVYPSFIAHETIVAAKKRFVAQVICATDVDAAPSKLGSTVSAAQISIVDRVWELPSLPFRVRSSLFATATYLIAPLSLAVIGSILPR